MCLAPKSLEHVALGFGSSDRWLARMERRITREWGVGLMFLSLKSLGVHGLKVMSARDYRYQNCMNVL
jgi:hypothetical protein